MLYQNLKLHQSTRAKRQPTEWEKILANIFDKGLKLRIYRELITQQKQNPTLENGLRHFSKENI